MRLGIGGCSTFTAVYTYVWSAASHWSYHGRERKVGKAAKPSSNPLDHRAPRGLPFRLAVMTQNVPSMVTPTSPHQCPITRAKTRIAATST